MPDKQDLPLRVSPLLPGNGDFIVDYKNVRLIERRALTAIQVLTFNGKHADAAAAITAALGIKCSTRPGIADSDGKTQVCWNGPNSWMVVCSDAEAERAPGELFKVLQDAVGELGAVVDQSHGRCGLRLSGLHARPGHGKKYGDRPASARVWPWPVRDDFGRAYERYRNPG